MKFKLFTIFMAIAVALAFTSCDNKKKGAKDNDDSEKSESVSSDSTSTNKDSRDDIAKFEPTGDPKKDAKMFADELIELYNNTDIQNEDDIIKFEDAKRAIVVKYERFYKERGKDGFLKFEDEYNENYKQVVKGKEEKIKDKITEIYVSVMNEDDPNQISPVKEASEETSNEEIEEVSYSAK